MINYVLGFAFNAKKEKVVLIKKNDKIPELAGKLNGLGGKQKRGEHPQRTMEREFFEESGVQIVSWMWREEGVFTSPRWSVKVFTACSDEILKAQTMEDEQVIIVRLRALPVLEEHQALCPNVSLLVGLCLNPRIKRFSFEEE